MPDLATGYRVLAVDLPGQGDSDRPADGYDTLTVAKRLDAFFFGNRVRPLSSSWA